MGCCTTAYYDWWHTTSQMYPTVRNWFTIHLSSKSIRKPWVNISYVINININKLQHRNMIIIWPSHCPYMVAFDMSRFSWMSRKCVLSWFHPLTSLHQNSGGHIFLLGTKISSIKARFFGWNRLGPPWNPWGAYWFLSPPVFGGVLWCASHLVSRLKSIYNII